jgi:hypothetical protein
MAATIAEAENEMANARRNLEKNGEDFFIAETPSYPTTHALSEVATLPMNVLASTSWNHFPEF